MFIYTFILIFIINGKMVNTVNFYDILRVFNIYIYIYIGNKSPIYYMYIHIHQPGNFSHNILKRNTHLCG